MSATHPRRVLVYRLGSIGDTVVALPCFRLVARAFPDAERRLLTVRPARGESAPWSLLEPTGLVSAAIDYPRRERSLAGLARIRRAIRAFRPDLLVYLADSRGALVIRRDVAFFRLAGVPRVLGAPLARDQRENRHDPDSGLWEPQARLLARCLAPLGDARVDDPASWDLGLIPGEHAAADRMLDGWPAHDAFFAVAAGAKVPAKDWGEARWRAAVERIGARAPAGTGLVLVGGAEDRGRAERLAAAWPGPARVAAGVLAPRESAALLARARFLLAHDGGPMHLAAAVGTPVVALFGGYNRPGVWHPFGAGHVVLHEPALDRIEPARVAEAALDRLALAEA